MTDQINSEQRDRIKEALVSGKKIEAIKIYRELTNLGLKECKEYIDGMISELIERDPEKYAKLSSSGSGCRSAAMFLFIIGSGIIAALKILV
jgi:hypothetical protein